MPSVKNPTFRRGEQFHSEGRREGGGREGVIKSSGTLFLPGLGQQSVNHRSPIGFIIGTFKNNHVLGLCVPVY